MKKKLLTLFLALVANVGMIYASNTSVGGIWYNFNSSNKTATVTYRGNYYNSYNGEYSGSVVIPSSVTYNGVTYSVTSIVDEAFRECKSLTSVTIPNSVTSIGKYTFYGCSSLTSVTIGNSVTSIENYAFAYCTSLTSVTIPNSVTSIGERAFYECSSLTSITIPNSVISIESSAFYGCSSLTSITIPNSVTSIGQSAFGRCYSLTSITIPNSVTSIADYAFSTCSSLTSVTIGNSVTSIGNWAFEDCSSLTSVTIGNSVTSIGNWAFETCTSLSTMIFKGENPPNNCGVVINSSNGTYDSSTPICYVPCGSLETYVSKFNKYMKQFVEQSLYSITINSSNDAYGIAKVASRPDCNSAILTAIPNEGCTFVKWSDGNTQATRYLELTEDITLTAYFAKEGYTIHIYQDCNTTIE